MAMMHYVTDVETLHTKWYLSSSRMFFYLHQLTMSQCFSGQPLLLQYFLTAVAVCMGLIYSKTELGFLGSNVVLSSEKERFLSSNRQVDKICYFQSPPFPLSIRHIWLSADCCSPHPQMKYQKLENQIEKPFYKRNTWFISIKRPQVASQR